MSGEPSACGPSLDPLLNTLHTLLHPADQLIFPAPRPSYDGTSFPWNAADLLWLRDPECGHQFPCVVVEPQDGAAPVRVVLFLHGNACDVGEVYSSLRAEAARWRALLVLVEYPGYGVSPGARCSAGIDRHVRAAFDHFTGVLRVPPERVVLYGVSVGTGPASRLALEVERSGARLGALILQSPYTSLRAAASAMVGPIAWLLAERWDNAAALAELICPVLILHGTADEVIPFAHGEALHALRRDAQPPLPSVLHAQPGASHNSWRPREDLSVPVAAFLAAQHAQGGPLLIRPQGPAGGLPRVWSR